MRLYMAISHRNGWTVGVASGASQYHKVRPHGDCRIFPTFDEADTVARAMADGQYNSTPGEYVPNR